jgi:hypothetical protein
MNTITSPIRMQVSEWAIRTLGRAITTAGRGLLAAGMSPTDINATLLNSVAVEHPNLVTERLLVLQVLERPGLRSRCELEIALGDVEPFTASDAFSALEAEGVLHTSGEQVWASRCVRHLDTLGFINV